MISPKDQLAILDQRLGPGVGAVKERAKLHKLLAQQTPVVPTEPEMETEPAKPKLKAKQRRNQ